MSILSNKDESTHRLNTEESKIKNSQKKMLNISINNKNQNVDISMTKRKLNKSINNLQIKTKKLDVSRTEGNILNDYLHSHKFGLQRKKTRRATTKSQRRKTNNMNKSVNKSRLFINNDNNHEWVSMIYYPDDEKKKNVQHDIINRKKDVKNNLKIVEKSMMDKLNNSMRNILQESVNENDNFDNYFDNNNNVGEINATKSYKSNNSNRSKCNDISVCSMNKNNNKNKQSLIVNKKYIKSQSLFSNRKNSYNRNSFLNSNLNSGFAPHLNKNLNKDNKYKSEILNNSFDLKIENINKIKKKSNHLKLTDLRLSKKESKKIKMSAKSLNMNEIKDKLRVISRVKPLYDSLDDDESEKDEENNQDSIIEPTSQLVFFLDLSIFISSIYCLFYIPLRMARTECFCGNEAMINIIILFVVDILYIADFCLGFFRGYYNFKLKLIKNNTRIIRHYLKTDFAVDLLEAIPIFTYCYSLCSKKNDANSCYKYDMPNSLIMLKILTNIKIFKIFKVRNKRKNVTYNYLLDIFSENYFFEKLIDNFLGFLFVFLAFHFFVCLNIFLSKQSYPNWLIINNSEEESLLYNYILSSYSLIETLTTVGYGDVVCQSQLERVFQIFFLGVGVIAYSYIISSFGNLIKNESQSSINYNNNLKILEEIRIDYPKMPYKLYNKIYHYIEQRNMAEKKSDANLLTNSLPFNLKNALLLVMYKNEIQKFRLFKNCENSNFIIQVLSNFVPATGRKNEILIYEGEMIEDFVIIKDGRLSLEAAIDMEDPENSIRKYFNVNFQGITSAKEAKKFKEIQKQNSSQLIQSKKTKDFDNAKNVLNKVVKKQVNCLLNEACDEPSILDRTKNEGTTKENENIKVMATECDYLKHEPIKNEKGNYKYIKIIDIRKNENFGGLYMFMRRPSPLSLKVKSKFADLYLLPKKEVFNIATSYNNIWAKIHKKDFHNMLSIKHKTLNILNKYIEINGIVKITPNDVSRFVYAWEDPDKKIGKFSEEIDYYNKSYDKNFFLFKRNSNQLCPSPILIKRDFSGKINNDHNNTRQTNENNVNHSNANYKHLNLFSKQSMENPQSPYYCSQHPVPTETDFSNLLAAMANEKKLSNSINNNNNSPNENNINNNNIKNNNINNINIINRNNNLTLKNNNFVENNNDNNNNNDMNDKNITNNNNNLNPNNINTIEEKNSASSLTSNFFNNKQKTKESNEDGKTLIMPTPPSSDKLLPTLNNIFNENKAEKIKEQMKKSRKKENRKKIFSFGKKTAELIRNPKFSLFLVGNTTNECFRIKSNFENSPKSLFKYNDKDIEGINNYISFCQDQIFLDKISEISSSEEYSCNHKFDKKTLSQEVVISFSLESIYQNLNIHTKMKYSQDKNIQQKTLNYLTHLIEKNSQSSSSYSQASQLYESSQSNSFNDYFEKKHKKKVRSSRCSNTGSISLSDSIMNSEILVENERYMSENYQKKKENSKAKKNDKNRIFNSLFTKTDGEASAFNSLQPKHLNIDNKNNKKGKASNSNCNSNNKGKEKLSLKYYNSNHERSSVNDIKSASNFNPKKENKKSLLSSDKNIIKSNVGSVHNNKTPLNTNCISLFGENKINNIKTVKNPKRSNKLNLNTSKRKIEGSEIKSEYRASSIKVKNTKKILTKKTKNNVKHSSTMKNKRNSQVNNKFKSEQKTIKMDVKKGEGDTAYFAKVEKDKEDCVII